MHIYDYIYNIFGEDAAEIQEILTIYPKLLLQSVFLSIAVALALFMLKGFAVYTMAKRRNFNKLWMAFVPFVNFVLIGKLIGEVKVWGKNIKNLGLFACIAIGVYTVLEHALNLDFYVLAIELFFNVRIDFTTTFMIEWLAHEGMLWYACYVIYNLTYYVQIILKCWIIFTIFRKYAPERAFIYSLVSIFIDFTFPILLFIIRKKEVSSFDDFIRNRNRYYQQQNQNNYGGFNQYNGNGYYNNPTPPKNEVDPFPEFSDKPQNTNN